MIPWNFSQRQVPDFMSQFQPSLQRHGILGRGKLARHWAHYLRQLGLITWQWEEARTLKDAFYSELPCTTHLWVLVSDSALAQVHERLKAGLTLRRIDKGAMQILHASAVASIAGMTAVHPLMTFGPELYALDTYRTIPLITFDSEIDADSSRRLLALLPNPQARIAGSARALYHALCSMSANFAQILWDAATRTARTELGLPPEAFAPIVLQTAQNHVRHGSEALTGPLIRGDVDTIEKHLHALRDQSLEPLYRAFVRAFIERKLHDHGARI